MRRILVPCMLALVLPAGVAMADEAPTAASCEQGGDCESGKVPGASARPSGEDAPRPDVHEPSPPPCTCDPDSPPSFSRVALNAFSGELDAVTAATGQSGTDSARLKTIARLFRTSELSFRDGLIAQLLGDQKLADDRFARAKASIDKLGAEIEQAQEEGSLQTLPASRLSTRYRRFASDVSGIIGFDPKNTCFSGCKQVCSSSDMECAGFTWRCSCIMKMGVY